MSPFLNIALNDARIYLRDKTTYIWLFLVPIAFVFFTGAANRGPGDPSNPKPGVLIDNLDEGPFGRLIQNDLENQGLYVLKENEKENAGRGIRIPKDFSEKLVGKERVELEFFKKSDSGEAPAALIEMKLFNTLVKLNAGLFELAGSGFTLDLNSTNEISGLLQDGTMVPLEVSFAGRKPIPTGFNMSLPGNLVMFLMMNLLIFGGSSLASERQTGVMRRFAVCPMQKWELVMGKVLGCFLLGGVQIVFFLFAGVVIFKVNIGSSLFPILLTLIIYGWVASSLGVLIGSTSSNPDKIVGLCIMVSILMAALGGCWWPLEIVPESMKLFAHFFPTAWAMDALHKLISFGGGLGDVTKELGVLALYAAGLNLVAGKVLKY